jgi:hypothetical protein
MKQIFEQLLQFLQRGIAEIFRFVHLVWNWSSEQITRMMQAPWENWPLWKQILLVIIIAAVAYALFVAAKQIWEAAINVLTAFANFLAVLVVTLPTILIAGVIALAGLWMINNFDPSHLRSLTLQSSSTGSSNAGSGRPSGQTTGQGRAETTGSR